MIKRTLYFGNPAYLSLRQGQLFVRLPEVDAAIALAKDHLDERFTAAYQKEAVASIPIEDIGLIIFDHPQVVFSQALLSVLLDHNIAVISCNQQHLPNGLFFPLAANTVQTERFKHQLEASQPLKKNLWQQTVTAKILNQAALLKNIIFPTITFFIGHVALKVEMPIITKQELRPIIGQKFLRPIYPILKDIVKAIPPINYSITDMPSFVLSLPVH
jgi:CRISPR-associated endonuclease Cas1 subtype II